MIQEHFSNLLLNIPLMIIGIFIGLYLFALIYFETKTFGKSGGKRKR